MFQMTNISVMWLLLLLLITKIIIIIIIALAFCTIIFYFGAQSNKILYHFYLHIIHQLGGVWDYYSCFSCGGNKRELKLLAQECTINKLVVGLSNTLPCLFKVFLMVSLFSLSHSTPLILFKATKDHHWNSCKRWGSGKGDTLVIWGTIVTEIPWKGI